MFYKFFLQPGQRAPESSLWIGMPDGGVVGEADSVPATTNTDDGKGGWTKTALKAHKMTAEEIDEWQDLLVYMEANTEFAISFEDFRDEAKLEEAKAAIVAALDLLISERKAAKP